MLARLLTLCRSGGSFNAVPNRQGSNRIVQEKIMEKHIMTWNYWLGIVLAVLAFLARGADVLGMGFLYFRGEGNSLGYHSYWDGAQLFPAAATEPSP